MTMLTLYLSLHMNVKIQFDKFIDIRIPRITLAMPSDSQF